VVAVATALVLWWFGLEQYAIWGLLAGVFNSIPYLGPVIVTAGLGTVAFMQFDDLLMTTYICGAAFLITSLEGFLLTPALMGRAAQMNPVAIFVGLLFWSSNLHVNLHYGSNLHHIIEAIFKALGRALDDATQLDPRVRGVLSTKGSLD
jgi:hypothetical protein